MTTEEKEKLDAYLKGIVLNLPDSPGCYQYLNDDGEIIYVGKAKNLKGASIPISAKTTKAGKQPCWSVKSGISSI